MLNILSKVYTQFVSLLHDILERGSDPGRDARQAIRQLDEQIRSSEEAVTDVIAELKLVQYQKEKNDEKIEKLGRIAKAAAGSGDQEAAIEAVSQQVQAEEIGDNLNQSVPRMQLMVDQLKGRLGDLRTSKQEMQHKVSMLEARSKVAEAESRAARYLGNVGKNNAIDFEAIEQKVDQREAKAAALVEMSDEKRKSSLDYKLKAYSKKEAVAAKLEALGIKGVLQNYSAANNAKNN